MFVVFHVELVPRLILISQSSLLRYALPSVRGLHNMPVLANNNNWEENGIKDFMTSDGFQFAWTDHQSWLVENLNRLTEGAVAVL